MDLILQFLTSSFGQFIINYHMNKLECNLLKLVNILVTAERTLKGSRHSILESLKEKGEMPCEGMLVIKSNLIIFSTFNWILDSDSSAHICTSMQGQIGSRRLRQSDMIFWVNKSRWNLSSSITIRF